MVVVVVEIGPKVVGLSRTFPTKAFSDFHSTRGALIVLFSNVSNVPRTQEKNVIVRATRIVVNLCLLLGYTCS